MKSSLNLLMLVALLIGIAPVMAVASDDEFPSVGAERVQDAVDQISASLVQRGFTILRTIDHGANANSVGLDLRPTQLIIYSDPGLEVRQLRTSNTVGIDLPMKILVWEDAGGAIRLTYNAPGYLIDRHGQVDVGTLPLEEFGNAQAQFGRLDMGQITVDSTQSFKNTVDSLLGAIEAPPPPGPPPGFFKIPLVLDYRDFASKIQGRRPPVLIVFGNPNVGTPLMQEEQSIGVDLPQKFLVWEDRQRQVHITYNPSLPPM